VLLTVVMLLTVNNMKGSSHVSNSKKIIFQESVVPSGLVFFAQMMFISTHMALFST
jgi:hypothetical protein